MAGLANSNWRSRGRVHAQSRRPRTGRSADRIDLPDGFLPEGISIGRDVVGRAGGVPSGSRVRRRIDAVLGTVLVGLGVRVALSSR